jgi:hypothetical protein
VKRTSSPRPGGAAAGRGLGAAGPLTGLLLAALVTGLAAADARAQWSVEIGVEHLSWHEDVSPIEVRERGTRGVIGVGFAQRRPRGALLAYRGSAYGGGADYRGSLLFDRTTPAQSTSVHLGTVHSVELRNRWPEAVDAVVGLEFELWRRRFSQTQREDYRVLSGRLGIEKPATPSRRIVAGGGLRWMLAASERATFTEAGVTYRVALSPGLGWNPYLRLGHRLTPRVTALAYWDGMRLGRSPEVALSLGGTTQARVYQPESDVNVLGVRVRYEP